MIPRFIRAIALRALAIRQDHESAGRIVELARSDPEPTVRARAIEALGMLKIRSDVVSEAKSSKHGLVKWTANFVDGQADTEFDYAALARQAYAGGLSKDKIDLAEVGKPAPDISVLTLDGKRFRLASILGKQPIAIYFTAHDS